MKPKKYYVWNDKVKVVCLADSPVEAVAVALSLYAFNRPKTYPNGWGGREDVDMSKISWAFFTVSTGGWRAIEGTTIEVDYNTYVTQYADNLITREIALDWFDNLMNKFDPFCENEDYDAI